MTQRMYYTDPYAQAFSARLRRTVEMGEHRGLVLDRTCFYPTSGGQRADRGELAGFEVLDVVDEESEIVHVVERNDRAVADIGSEVSGKIDWTRRFDHMQQHTGQHILSQAFHHSAGASTLSFHMGEELSTIDLDLEAPTAEQIRAAEELANRIVFENRAIRVDFVPAEAQTELGLRKRSERTGTLRLVTIDGFDRSACGGTHCSRTGEVGLIKVRRWDRVRQKARLEFVCGFRALRDYRMKTGVVSELVQQFSVSEEDLPAACARQQEAAQDLRRRYTKLQTSNLEAESARAVGSAARVKDREIVRGIWDALDMKQLNRLASLILADAPGRIALLASRGEGQGLLLLARNGADEPDMRDLLREAAAEAGGRGGGAPDRAQAGGCRNERLERALERAFERAVEKL